MVVLMTPEGKRVIVDRDRDMCLLRAPRNPPNTGTRYTTGIDLYAHKSRSGKWYFYRYRWSMWQGDEDSFELISEEEAKAIFISRMGGSYWVRPTDAEIRRALEFWPDLLQEDA